MVYYYSKLHFTCRNFKILSIEERANLNLWQAITEHRWKDALILLPVAISSTNCRSSSYFLWKCLHVIMVNCDVSQQIQFKIFLTFLKPWKRHPEMAIEWLSQVFMHISEEKLDAICMAIKSMDICRMPSQSRSLLHGYYALLVYYQWKQLRSSEEETEEIVKLGLKAFNLLSKAFKLTESSIKMLKESSNDNMAFGYPIEWLFAPLLELIEYLNHLNVKKGLNAEARNGFTMITDYLSENKGYLPSLITGYHFISTYYPKKTSLIIDFLKDISSLSPENCLVLNYVDDLIGDNVKQSFIQSDSSERHNDSCLLAGQDIDVLLQCVKLLCAFLEYEMWWKHEKAWATLASILQLFHRSWLQCWKCLKCKMSKKGLSKLASSLSLWPLLFWNSHAISQFINYPQVLVYSAFASFIFGYKLETVTESVNLCKHHGYKKQKKNLHALVHLCGKYSEKFDTYLNKQRSRFPTEVPILPSKSINGPEIDNLVIHDPVTYKIKKKKCIKFEDMEITSHVPYFGELTCKRKRETSPSEDFEKKTRSRPVKYGPEDD